MVTVGKDRKKREWDTAGGKRSRFVIVDIHLARTHAELGQDLAPVLAEVAIVTGDPDQRARRRVHPPSTSGTRVKGR